MRRRWRGAAPPGARRQSRGRGWDRMMAEQVLQADEGCDLAVLRAGG